MVWCRAWAALADWRLYFVTVRVAFPVDGGNRSHTVARDPQRTDRTPRQSTGASPGHRRYGSLFRRRRSFGATRAEVTQPARWRTLARMSSPRNPSPRATQAAALTQLHDRHAIGCPDHTANRQHDR